MFVLWIFGLCYLVFVLFDIMPLWRQRDWKLLCLYGGLMLSSWLVVAVLSGGLSLPNPEPFLKEVISRWTP